MPLDFGDFPFDAFADEAVALLGDEGAAYAENIEANLTGSVRPQRNALEAGTAARKRRADLIADARMELTPQNERNLEASFKTHLKAMQRRVADAVGQSQKARTFMGVSPDKDPVILKLAEHAEGNQPNLGTHPHSRTLSVPIPPDMESVAPQAAKMLKMTNKQRQTEFLRLMRERSGGSVVE